MSQILDRDLQIIFPVAFRKGEPTTGGELSIHTVAVGLSKLGLNSRLINMYSMPNWIPARRKLREITFVLWILYLIIFSSSHRVVVVVLTYPLIPRLNFLMAGIRWFNLKILLWIQRADDITRDLLSSRNNRLLIKYANAVIAVSDEVKEKLISTWDISSVQIRIVHPPLNKALLERLLEIRRDYTQQRNTINLLCVSNVISRKGVGYVIPALVRVNEMAHLRIVGDAEKKPKYTKQLMKLIKELDLASRVTFAGWVNNEETYQYYLNADIFVFPSLAEGYPKAPIEAAASGLPIIMTSSANTHGLLEHEESALIVPPKDVSMLEEAIIRLMEDAKLRERLGTKAKEMVKSLPSEDITIEVLQVIKEVVQR